MAVQAAEEDEEEEEKKEKKKVSRNTHKSASGSMDGRFAGEPISKKGMFLVDELYLFLFRFSAKHGITNFISFHICGQIGTHYNNNNNNNNNNNHNNNNNQARRRTTVQLRWRASR